MAKAKKSSNLFSISHETVRANLSDAHASLFMRRDAINAKLAIVPKLLETDEEIEGAQAVVDELEKIIKDAKAARLADGKPFRDASKTVQTFFDEIEKPLKNELQKLLDRFTETYLSRQPNTPEDLALSGSSVGIDVSGKPIVTVSASPPHSSVLGEKLAVVWEVDSIDRAALDLEKLRSYLTDAALLTACGKHLDEHGPNKIAGVAYHKVAQLK